MKSRRPARRRPQTTSGAARRARVAVPAALALALTASACTDKADTSAAGSGGAGGPIAVTATDTECTLARTETTTGTTTFQVTNKGTKINEFYVLADGDRIVSEVENIGPGLTRELKVELTEPAKLTTACKPGMVGDGIRGAFTVAGPKVEGSSADAKVQAAITAYEGYVRERSADFLAKTKEFAAAVKAGDVAKAKQLYPHARLPWEEIEPVAETFGDLDPKIDGREDVIAEGMPFTGYHRLEKDLWVTGLRPDSAKIADQLVADVTALDAQAQKVKVGGVQIAEGGKALLDEVATGKITGEEERYSHTDLYDFYGNLEGTRKVVDVLRPVLAERNPTLLGETDKALSDLRTELLTHRTGEDFVPFTQLTADEKKRLSTKLDIASEKVAQLAGVVDQKPADAPATATQ